MVGSLSTKTEAANKVTEIAIAGIKDGTYASVNHAVKELGVSKATLHRRLKGGKSRSEAQEKHQLLTKHEETALAKWISSSAASGNPVQHDFIREMAEKLRKQRVTPDGQFIPPIGSTWVPQFLRRHSHLKTKMTRAIETARIKDVTKELVLHFNEEFRRIIREHNIRLENIYNADETGLEYSIVG
jgi:hypothetical protein